MKRMREKSVRYHQDLYDKFQSGELVIPPLDDDFVRAEKPIDLRSETQSPGEILADYKASQPFRTTGFIRGLERVTDPDTGEVIEGFVWPLIQYPWPWQE